MPRIVVLSLCMLMLAGCSSCPPLEQAAPTRQVAAQLEYQPFAAVIAANSAQPQREALKAFSAQLTAELSKVGTLPDDAQALAPEIRAAFLEGQAWLSGLECRDGQALEHALKRIVEQRPYVAITPADVDWLKQAFTPEALDQRMNAIAETLDALPADSAERRRLQHDPLDLIEHARATLQARLHAAPSPFATKADGFFIAADGRTALVLGWAARPRAHPEFSAALLNACERAKVRALAVRRAHAKAGGEAGDFAIQFVTSGSAGAEAAREQARAAFQRSLTPLRVGIETADESQAIAAAAQVRERLQALVERGAVAPLATVLDLIPSEAAQRENFAALRSFDFAAALKAFQTAASKRFGTLGLVFFKPFLQRFEKFGLLTREPGTLSLRDALAGSLHAELAPYLQVNADGTLRRSLWYFPKSNATVIPELERVLAGPWPQGMSVRVFPAS